MVVARGVIVDSYVCTIGFVICWGGKVCCIENEDEDVSRWSWHDGTMALVLQAWKSIFG